MTRRYYAGSLWVEAGTVHYIGEDGWEYIVQGQQWKKHRLAQPPPASSRFIPAILVTVLGAIALIVVLLLTGCAPQQQPWQPTARSCSTVAIDTVIVTGVNGQRVGLERRRCP